MWSAGFFVSCVGLFEGRGIVGLGCGVPASLFLVWVCLKAEVLNILRSSGWQVGIGGPLLWAMLGVARGGPHLAPSQVYPLSLHFLFILFFKTEFEAVVQVEALILAVAALLPPPTADEALSGSLDTP